MIVILGCYEEDTREVRAGYGDSARAGEGRWKQASARLGLVKACQVWFWRMAIACGL